MSARSYSAATVIAVAIAALGLLGSAPARAEDTVDFDYAPPDGLEYRETVQTTRVVELPGGRPPRREERTSTNRGRVKKDGDVYRLAITTVTGTATRDGIAMPPAMLAAMIGNEIVFVVSAKDGQIQKIEGLDAALKRAMPAVPEAMVQAMDKRERAEWNGRIGDFAAGAMRIGQTVTATSDFVMPTGQALKYETAITLVERVKHAGRDCVRIKFEYRTTDAGPIKVSGGGERVIEPATLLIHSEELTRVMDMGPMGKQTETRKYSYEYPKP